MGRGFSVGRLYQREMSETGAILCQLELLALQLSPNPGKRLGRLTEIDRELAGIRSDIDRLVAMEEEWHRTLLADCPNQRLLSIISNLWQVPRRYMRAYLREARRVSISTQHHARIIEAVRRDDRDNASDRLRHYWDRGIEELSSWMQR